MLEGLAIYHHLNLILDSGPYEILFIIDSMRYWRTQGKVANIRKKKRKQNANILASCSDPFSFFQWFI